MTKGKGAAGAVPELGSGPLASFTALTLVAYTFRDKVKALVKRVYAFGLEAFPISAFLQSGCIGNARTTPLVKASSMDEALVPLVIQPA